MDYEEMMGKAYAVRGYLVGCCPADADDVPYIGRIYACGVVTFNQEPVNKPFRCTAVTDIEDMRAQFELMHPPSSNEFFSVDDFSKCLFFRFETD